VVSPHTAIVKREPISHERVQALLPEIVRRLREALQPERIYLFGSCAYGTVQRDSDVDLLVVIPESTLSFYQRSAAAYRALRRIGVPVDVLVYTRAEFDVRAALPVSFERTVQKKGQVVYAGGAG
jgi:predicted nucleotidyltransferase